MRSAMAVRCGSRSAMSIGVRPTVLAMVRSRSGWASMRSYSGASSWSDMPPVMSSHMATVPRRSVALISTPLSISHRAMVRSRATSRWVWLNSTCRGVCPSGPGGPMRTSRSMRKSAIVYRVVMSVLAMAHMSSDLP